MKTLEFILRLYCNIVPKIRPNDEVFYKDSNFTAFESPMSCFGLQFRKKNPTPVSQEQSDRKMEETYFYLFFYCLSNLNIKFNNVKQENSQLKIDNSNSCNRSFIMCCLSNKKSFCCMFASCFRFNQQPR